MGIGTESLVILVTSASRGVSALDPESQEAPLIKIIGQKFPLFHFHGKPQNTTFEGFYRLFGGFIFAEN
jgi:hypothetical protein